MKKIVYVLLLVFTSLLSLTGCGKKVENNVNIVSFKYSYGSHMGFYYDYTLTLDGDDVTFNKYIYGEEEQGTVMSISASSLEDIKKIINENEIYKWDGFDKSNDNVMDGSEFNLEVIYDDGSKIVAHGYMKYPDNYEESSKPLKEYLDSID